MRRHGAGQRREAAMLLHWGQAEKYSINITRTTVYSWNSSLFHLWLPPDGMMTDRAVAEADLITLPPALELRLSPSPDRCGWRALRRTRSLVALGPRGSYRGVITSRPAAAGLGDSVEAAAESPGVSPCLGDLSVRIKLQLS